MDVDSPSIPPRFDARRVADKDDSSRPLSAPNRVANLAHGKMHHDLDPTPTPLHHEVYYSTDPDATSLRVARPDANSTRRDRPATMPAPDSHPPPPTENASNPPLRAPPPSQRPQPPFSSSNSQDTSSNDADLVFTPPASEGAMSPSGGSAQDSSQESQLLQLSQIAAAQERIPDGNNDPDEDGASKKRMADGSAKHARSKSSASPIRMGGHGHSRNTSTVSIASTTGSRAGELSAELKARLGYAMVKVKHGWQSHTIDQVETLASQAGSPASSTSTIHLRNGSSASPQLSTASHRGSNNTTPATGLSHQFPPRLSDHGWRETYHSGLAASPTSPVKISHALAPPVSIQPSRQFHHPRRNSNPKLTPTFLSGSPHTGPNTPGQPSPYVAAHRTPLIDPMVFSPHQNVREKDAIESLLFMSSPGNSANLKHAFPSSSQPLPSTHSASQRTALPTSQPRKSLPTGRPTLHARSQSHSQKRVGFEKSLSDMDIDDAHGAYSRGAARRKVNGSGAYSHSEAHGQIPRAKQLPVSTGLTIPPRPRPALADEDIDRMLDRVAAADDSDSESEIQIPVSRARRDGARVIGA
ncbi:hypothetical protein OQA88_9157 [Cercophora sp. LCS_1]